MNKHSFDAEIASEVGMQAAVLFENIRFWIAKNAANDKHVHDGKVWTYNSMSAFSALFPYMTVHQIRRALEKLEEVGLIVSGNFNETAYDRTKWYCLSRQIHLANLPNRNGSDAQPIPDSKPDDKPDIKPDTDQDLFSQQDSESERTETPDELFEIFWSLYPPRTGANPKKNARAKFKTALKSVSWPKLRAAVEVYARSRQGEDPKYTPMAATWLNQERWDEFLSSAANPAVRRRMNPDDPFDGMPESVAAVIRLEIDPEMRDADARAWWARQEAAE